jgi:glycosyltransferase involved in cell wall biosynthesis
VKILVVSQFFPPEMGAPASRFYDFSKHWLVAGHEVSVITGFPNFPGGVVHEGYRGKLYQREVIDGVHVHRCFLFTGKWRRVQRALTYVTFLASSLVCALLTRTGADVVVATIPPPTVGLPGLLASLRRRAPLLVDLRDIWPEAIVQSGRLRNPLVIRLFEGIAGFLYRRAERIAVVTHGWKERLVEKGVPAEKIEVLSNGVDVGAFDAEAGGELPEAFAALDPAAQWFSYAGILNTPQGLEVILEAAARVRERAPELYARSQWVLVGEGPTETELRALQQKLHLDRVVFVPRQPRAAVFSLLRRSFGVLVTLRPRKDTSTVPSKIYECMASGNPVLFSAAGEGGETIRRAGAGSVCTPGDPDALAEAMLTYLRNPELAAEHGRSGRQHVLDHYDRRKIAAEYLALMEAAARR